MEEYQKYAKDMLKFIEKSPSCFHVIYNIGQDLKQDGYVELKETEEWKLAPGGKYFVVRGDSSVIAFRLPEKRAVTGFHIVASHSDSPTFKIKEAPEMTVESRYVKLNTEQYGGMILSTWMDRALSVAGRIAVQQKAAKTQDIVAKKTDSVKNIQIIEEKEIMTKLVNIDKDLLVIPNLAIHMNRDVNKGMEYNPQTDMLPLFADCSDEKDSKTFLESVAQAAGVEPEDILGHDLFLYVREKGRMLGERGEFILSPRLDDLQCVYTSVKAFRESCPVDYINVCAVFDNEEVGSCTRQGANSTFLEDTLMRIGGGLNADRSEYLRWIAGSFLISADNAHAVHPNHPEKADPTNRPYLNGGLVIKYHGSQKYTTDGVSAAKMKSICMQAGIPFQTYANRSDIAGGSTLGNISNSHVSVSSVDVGLPQLAMHSSLETAGTKDVAYAVRAFQVFFGE
ncbi:MAG: M18 family aminopeptidase [Lachnoclostridium sp.]|nr:M18 family aminopeptidase [Lachnospira sp.]MCM1247031.1 M18 family aminopeptidase [Lachnoclostridium sp.]